MVLATIEVVGTGVSLVIVGDREPAALRSLGGRRYGARLGWADRGRSGDRFAASIRLTAPAEIDAVRPPS